MTITIAVDDQPLNVAVVAAALGDDAAGAVSLFLGVVRAATIDGQPLVALDYHAHQPMAHAEMTRVARAMTERWPGLRAVALLHRLGTLTIGQASVVVGVSSPHRAEALAATAWGIDEIKRRVPIWKREVLADGSRHWVVPAP